MKKVLFIIGLLFLCSCNEGSKENAKVRYTQDSEEINTLKAVIKNYEDGDWEKYKKHFSDTAKFYWNSREAIEIDEVVASHQESIKSFSSYDFPDEMDEFEMVNTNDDETWVNYWGNWQATIAENDSMVDMPVHITARFVDGKIVAEHVYYNNAGISQALAKLSEARMKNKDSLDQN